MVFLDMSHIFIFPCCTSLVSQVNTSHVISAQDSHLSRPLHFLGMWTFLAFGIWHASVWWCFGYMPHIFISLCCTSLNTRFPIYAHSRYVNISDNALAWWHFWIHVLHFRLSNTPHHSLAGIFSVAPVSCITKVAHLLLSLLFIVIDNLDDQFKQWYVVMFNEITSFQLSCALYVV
jgi:hypothetical protein